MGEHNYFAEYVMGAVDYSEFQRRHDELGLMIVKAVAANTHTAVASLRMSIPSLSHSAGIAIVGLLPANSSLTSLELENPRFTDDTDEMIYDALVLNRDFPMLVQ